MATPLLYPSHIQGDVLPAADWNDAFGLAEASVLDLGPLIISGLVPSAGTGLAVNVTSGVASIGGQITFGAFSIGSLAASTTNHLYILQTGLGTSNTTGTAPASSVKLGTCITGASTVTSVATTWAAGRQFKRRTDEIVHGSGAGHPRAVDLASWHATNNEGNETKGVLPAGAVSTSGMAQAQSTKTANYTATSTDYFLWGDATSGNITITLPTAVGIAGCSFVIKKIDSSANTVTIATTSSQTIDGVTTHVISVQYTARALASNNADWFIY